MINEGLFSSKTDQWNTPEWLVWEIEGFFSGAIDLDPCSDGSNIPAMKHYTEKGLELPWHGKVFMNPPYGRDIGKWVQKALTEEVDEIVMLLPSRTDTKWFIPLFDHTICFISGRLKFGNSENSAPFPSCLVYAGPRSERFIRYFSPCGRIVRRVG